MQLKLKIRHLSFYLSLPKSGSVSVISNHTTWYNWISIFNSPGNLWFEWKQIATVLIWPQCNSMMYLK